jgi:hypothetical protein
VSDYQLLNKDSVLHGIRYRILQNSAHRTGVTHRRGTAVM